ncbi:MAG: DNA-processing protein DprA, partial [Candidatus Ornithomonoglobus sp.]
AEMVRARMKEIGGRIITIEDEEYPALLKEIYSPPAVLYALGAKLNDEDELRIAVVGTRKYSAYGRRACEKLSKALAEKGAVIVSGMALGIDTFAAAAAVNAGRKTIAVLGSGIDVIYPYQNKDLYKEICRNGTILSEYPPGTRPLGYNFPRRNRIIAGLAQGTLVIQAPEKSGALITARYALENNRDVFAVPGEIYDINQVGTNELIKAGAKPVTCAEDILEEYGFEAPEKNEVTDRLAGIDMSGLSKTEAEILQLLNVSPLHPDEITRKLGVPGAETGTALMMLEISGLVVRDSGNIYDLK